MSIPRPPAVTSGRDPLTPEQRRRNMSAIRGRDTRPELIVRRALHAAGLRYRLHGALPGRPDLVFPGRRAVIFVHGCFWHGHACPMFKIPATRQEFWLGKIEGNQARDARVQAELLGKDWRVMTIWECAIRGKARLELPAVTEAVRGWLEAAGPLASLGGDWAQVR